MSCVRDSQRQKLYDAEREAFTYNQDFSSWEELVKYVDKLTSSYWYKSRCAHLPILKYSGHKYRGGATCNYRTIVFGVNSYCKWIVIHELSHVIINYLYQFELNKIAGHGPEFAKMYLEMIGRFLGEEARETLRKSYVKYGVKFTENVKNYLKPTRKYGKEIAKQYVLAREQEKAATVAKKQKANIRKQIYKICTHCGKKLHGDITGPFCVKCNPECRQLIEEYNDL